MINFTTLQVIFLIAFAVVLGWNIFLQWQYFTIKKRLKAIFNGSKASDLEGVISQTTKRLLRNEKDIKEIKKFTMYLERMGLSSIQKIGAVRFNPFKDTGGNQSFCICLLDGRNNGVIISSLFTRDGNRVFAKPISEGESKFPLTREESNALKKTAKQKI